MLKLLEACTIFTINTSHYGPAKESKAIYSILHILELYGILVYFTNPAAQSPRTDQEIYETVSLKTRELVEFKTKLSLR